MACEKWAGTVDVILNILLEHNALGSPLSNLARLAVTPCETSTQFSRRLRQLIFTLPSDVLLGEQAREVIQQHVRQFLHRTWTYIQQHTSSLPSDELADKILQITEENSQSSYELFDGFTCSKTAWAAVKNEYKRVRPKDVRKLESQITHWKKEKGLSIKRAWMQLKDLRTKLVEADEEKSSANTESSLFGFLLEGLDPEIYDTAKLVLDYNGSWHSSIIVSECT
ncbi:hypothetical protein EPUL_002719 [Erysiphe pulchra]|uniref:Uncharacterized protein n=1 Tax=Erysiphe pulchra TaxID=225359 RepID=A0A2S4PNT6_9PEZI|nr:hypothetical protein EPUL_002719 [Erysiphe pulchra]